jgi:hypothetical protein
MIRRVKRELDRNSTDHLRILHLYFITSEEQTTPDAKGSVIISNGAAFFHEFKKSIII